MQQPGQVERCLLRADPEAARGPVHVPALPGIRRVELAAPLALPGQGPGRRDTARERGHAILSASPDRVVPLGPSIVDPVLQPVMGDAAAHPEPLHDAPDQDHVPVRVRQLAHRCDRAPELEILRERGDPPRVRKRDLDGGGPGELQGAAHPGTEPELQDHLEGQPLGDQLPRVLRPRVLAREQPIHVLAAVQVGWDHGGQPLRRARLADHIRDQVVQVRRAAAVVQDRRDERTEGEGIGAAGDEPGAVRRVLYRVIEQERLALRVLKLTAGEQLGDGDRGQAGQARTEEPATVVHPACRAPVVLGRVHAILVVPDVT